MLSIFGRFSKNKTKNKTKKVLVLCQRKKSNIDSNSVDETVENLNNFVENYFIDKDIKAEIEYLTPGCGFPNEIEGFADHEFALTDNDPNNRVDQNTENCYIEETENFIKKNKGTYSLIILNTCPFVLMPYESLYQLLENDGVITFKRGSGENFDTKNSIKLMDSINNSTTINKYFYDISYRSRNGEVYLLFKKKNVGGNKTMGRKINRKIVRKYKQKTRKYKKYKRN
jgi:hypothetical protein